MEDCLSKTRRTLRRDKGKVRQGGMGGKREASREKPVDEVGDQARLDQDLGRYDASGITRGIHPRNKLDVGAFCGILCE